MSDLAMFEELMSKLEVPLKPVILRNGNIDYEVMAKCSPKVGGYTGFVALFTFDCDGNLIEMSIAE